MADISDAFHVMTYVIRRRQFTKEYASMFLEAGIMPTRKLTRFTISPEAALAPGTRLRATHFQVGDYVDVYGQT